MIPIVLAAAMFVSFVSGQNVAEIVPAPPRESGLALSTTRAQNPKLPFETGWLTVAFRGAGEGGPECKVASRGSGFDAVAARICEERPPSSRRVESEFVHRMVIVIVRDGETALPLEDLPGRMLFDMEFEVEVASDGSVVACRILREVKAEGLRLPLGDGQMCRDVTDGRPVFARGAPTGPRRATVRFAMFLEGDLPMLFENETQP